MNSMHGVELVLIIASANLLIVLMLGALLGRRSRGETTNIAAIRQYRDWQGQCSTWSAYWELEDMIDEERAKGG